MLSVGKVFLPTELQYKKHKNNVGDILGLYDLIHIEYQDLPMPKNASEKEIAYIKQSLSADVFQTKDLDDYLNHYLIDQYGKFFKLNVSDFDQTIGEQQYIHQHITCYNGIDVDQSRYWIEYDFKFTDGIVSAVQVLEWKKIK